MILRLHTVSLRDTDERFEQYNTKPEINPRRGASPKTCVFGGSQRVNRVACTRVGRSPILRSKTLRALDMLPHQSIETGQGQRPLSRSDTTAFPLARGRRGSAEVQGSRFAENRRVPSQKCTLQGSKGSRGSPPGESKGDYRGIRVRAEE